MQTSTATSSNKPAAWNPSQWGKRLHALAHKLGMTNDDYRAALHHGFGVTSSRNLTAAQAASFAQTLQAQLDQCTTTATPRPEPPPTPAAAPAATPAPAAMPAPAATPAAAATEQRYCSPQQIRLMRFHAIPVAIHYCPADQLGTLRVHATGQLLRGEDLRAHLRTLWDRFGMERNADPATFIPPNIMQRLYTHYINPRCHQMMVEGGLKRWYKDGRKFYPHYQSPADMHCLISRWRALHTSLAAAHERVLPDPLLTTNSQTANSQIANSQTANSQANN